VVADDEVMVEVTFCRSGLYVGGRMMLEGATAALPARMARLSPDEQRAELGDHFFDVGAASGAPRAEHVDANTWTRVVKLVEIEDAAAVLNRGVSTLRRAIAAGRLRPARKIGNRVLFDLADVWALHRNPERVAEILDGERLNPNRVRWASTLVLRDRSEPHAAGSDDERGAA
jgi:excisionase family DNA binding protein